MNNALGHFATRRLVEEINETHRLRYALTARCRDGLRGGAWLLADPAGRPAVLKWTAHGSAWHIGQVAAAVARIRAARYPTPRWLVSGVTAGGVSYHVQEFVPGRPAYPLTAGTAELLIEVLERQAGLDPYPARNWSDRVIATVQDDCAAGPRRVLAGLGSAGRRILRRYDRLVASFGTQPLPGADMVHGDFNTCNILLDAARVSGIVDIAELGSGSRVIDYACLLREAYLEGYGAAVTRLLRRAGEAVAGSGPLAVCVAATAFEIVPFKLRHDPQRVPVVLARLCQLADELG